VDPIHPIAPGPPAIPPSAAPAVERPERITRERDRPAWDRNERKRREPSPTPAPEHDEDDGEHPHIDVRA
jgi:hypothetical protein